jgi:hypothetical protein
MALVGRLFLFVLASLFSLLVTHARAQPDLRVAPPAEARTLPSTGLIPACSDPFVLAEIITEFRDRETTYWASGLEIVGWAAVWETGYRSNGLSYIPRRYCEGLADFNDGLRRNVGYNLGEGLGFSGVGWGVDWCVVGLDRDLSFAPACKMTQP